MIIVYTSGVFDLLHPGHINLLRRARAFGDKLIVDGLTKDFKLWKNNEESNGFWDI